LRKCEKVSTFKVSDLQGAKPAIAVERRDL
jgi:hypothetical protein